MKRKEDLPLTLTVSDVQEILGLSKPIAYQLTRRADFPALRVGRKILIPRDKFFEWYENHAEKGAV